MIERVNFGDPSMILSPMSCSCSGHCASCTCYCDDMEEDYSVNTSTHLNASVNVSNNWKVT